MALPPPNQTQQQMRQYQDFSTREAIGTAMRAGFLQFQANQIAKSSFLKMIPGAGIVRERAEMKRRELYEKQGRDDQGRKLTKQEFEEREKRRADMGKLAEIHDIIQSWNDKWGGSDDGVAVYFKKDSDILFLFESMEAHIKLIHGFLTGASTVGTSTYGSNQSLSLDDVPDRNTSGDVLEAEELAQEQEREDDQDQLESEERQQGFFTKLFGGLGRNRQESPGILSSLLSWLGSLGSSLFSGGLSKFLSSLIGPIMSVMGTLMSSVLGFIGPMMAAVGPILVAALPAILALLLAGAAGLVIKKFIDEKTEKMLEAGERRGKQSIKKKYEVSDGKGGTTLKTAEELGTTDFKLSESVDEKTGLATLPSGEAIDMRKSVDFVVDEEGKITNSLSNTNTEQMREIFKRVNKTYQSQQAKDTAAEGAGVLSKHDWIMKDADSLNYQMSQYQSLYDLNVKNINDPTTGQMLADEWNRVKTNSRKFVDKLDELAKKGGIDERTAADYGKKLLDIYSNQYGVFEDSLFDGEDFVYGYMPARYHNGGVMAESFLQFPSDKAGFWGGWVKNQWATDADFTGTRVLDYDIEKAVNEGRDLYSPSLPPSAPTVTPPPPPGAEIPSTSSENAALQSAPSNAVSVNTNTNNVNQSNSAVIASGVSARAERTGIENPIWNGYFATA